MIPLYPPSTITSAMTCLVRHLSQYPYTHNHAEEILRSLRVSFRWHQMHRSLDWDWDTGRCYVGPHTARGLHATRESTRDLLDASLVHERRGRDGSDG
jgi:hypothetical protein